VANAIGAVALSGMPIRFQNSIDDNIGHAFGPSIAVETALRISLSNDLHVSTYGIGILSALMTQRM